MNARFRFAARAASVLALASLAAIFLVAGTDLLPPGARRLAAGLLVVLGYAAFCARIFLKRRALSMAAGIGGAPAPDALLVAYASQTGFAEQIARRSAQALEAAGLPVHLASLADLGGSALQRFRKALFVVSTTGEGDAPDSAAGFARKTLARDLPLAGLGYGVLALGDSSYRQYCAFGQALADWLHRQGAEPMFDTVRVDDGDAGALRHWQHYLNVLGASAEMEDWARPDYQRWTLAERRCLNPGSPGDPAYHVALAPAQGAACAWSAGDIAEIGPRNDPSLPHREYSIASLPADGRLELLVRQMRYPDGRLGLGSGWLTHEAPLGGTVDLRVRENRGFHPPSPGQPLVLIGNGTGMAGLRAHLKARAAAGARSNWLLFGERTSAHDYFYRQEIEAWRTGGLLSRVDLAFSREPGGPRYVQDCLPPAAETLKQWVGRGAAIYVCGSLQGMAAGVAAALEGILGRDRLDELAEQGRYRRDVY